MVLQSLPNKKLTWFETLLSIRYLVFWCGRLKCAEYMYGSIVGKQCKKQCNSENKLFWDYLKCYNHHFLKNILKAFKVNNFSSIIIEPIHPKIALCRCFIPLMDNFQPSLRVFAKQILFTKVDANKYWLWCMQWRLI